MKPFTVPGLLRAAASYIEVHGHEQRGGENGGMGLQCGPCCPIAACHRLTSNSNLRYNAKRALWNSLPCWIARWSDRTPTAEVLATMRRVARELDHACR